MLVIEAPVLATRTTKKHGITTGLRAQYESAGPPFRASLRIVASQVILYSINDNLGLFRSQSLLDTFCTWMRAFPIRRKPVTVSLTGVGGISFAGSASASIEVGPITLEDRVARLERELGNTRREIQQTAAEASRQLEVAKTELNHRIGDAHDRLIQLGKKVEAAAVGGLKLQLFGVLLAVYGAITSVYA